MATVFQECCRSKTAIPYARTNYSHLSPTNAAEFLVATHLYYSFRKSPAKQFDVINGGLPVLTATSEDNSPHKAPSTPLIARFKVFIQHISSLQELNTRIAGTIFRALARIYSGALTHRLVAGQHYLPEALRGKKQGTTILFGHSDDYSNYLRNSVHYTTKTPGQLKIAVLLDAPGPAFTDDQAQLGYTLPSTAQFGIPHSRSFSTDWRPKLVYLSKLLDTTNQRIHRSQPVSEIGQSTTGGHLN